MSSIPNQLRYNRKWNLYFSSNYVNSFTLNICIRVIKLQIINLTNRKDKVIYDMFSELQRHTKDV